MKQFEAEISIINLLVECNKYEFFEYIFQEWKLSPLYIEKGDMYKSLRC